MFNRLFRKIRRQARHWTTDPTRADRNAVIQRVVAAAAKESKDNLSNTGEPVRRTSTPPPSPSPLQQPMLAPPPSPLAAQLLGQELPVDELIPTERIGQRAFEIWVRNGRPVGTASRDWIQAEAELRAERAQP